MRKVALATVASVALVAAAIVAWILRPGQDALEEPAPASSPAPKTGEIPQLASTQKPHAGKLPDAMPSEPTADAACDGSMLWLAVNSDCARVLDAAYLDRVVSDGWLFAHPVDWTVSEGEPSVGTPTWRELLADPLSDREAVADSLARAECHVAGGLPPPAECAAEAIARTGLLQKACVMALTLHEPGFNPYAPEDEAAGGPAASSMDDARFDEAWQWHVDELASASLSQDEYWRGRATVDEARRMFGWRLMRCREVPRDALAWIPALPTPTGEPFDDTQAPVLALTAARLGVSWVRQPDAAELRALARRSRP